MTNTMVEAKFEYRGFSVTARRIFDSKSGKFRGWYGLIDGTGNYVSAQSVASFNDSFQMIIDKLYPTDEEA